MSLEDFYTIHSAEDYFEFFDLEYDENLIRNKRALIMKAFGDKIKKAQEKESDEQKLLEFFRFALLSVYKNFECGEAPSAAEIWGIKEGSGGCFACSIERTCDTKESGCPS